MEKGKTKHQERYDFSYFYVMRKKRSQAWRLRATGVFPGDNNVLIKEKRWTPVYSRVSPEWATFGRGEGLAPFPFWGAKGADVSLFPAPSNFPINHEQIQLITQKNIQLWGRKNPN